MNLVFSNDFLFHGQEEAPAVLHQEFFSLIGIVLQDATGTSPHLITRCGNAAGERFSRKRFFELSGIHEVADSYFLYDIAKISAASWSYFKSFFDKDTVFIASEFGSDLREKLTELGYTYVNFWFHPYKLFNDSFFLVGTNSPSIFQKLERYRVPSVRMRFYGEYYAQLARRKHLLDNLPIEDNCCVFAGQTYQDKSIAFEGRYLNITDYPDKVRELAKSYSRVYYVPHPAAKPNPEVDAFLQNTEGVEVLNGVPTYFLLASPKVKKVVALSSSVLYEAAFFGKETEYLFRPLFKIDEEFSLDTFVSIYQDYFSPVFWRDILSLDGDETPPSTLGDRQSCLLARNADMYRDLLGLPFGYRYFGRFERMEDSVSHLQDDISNSISQIWNAQRNQLEAEEQRLKAFAALSEQVSDLDEALRHQLENEERRLTSFAALSDLVAKQDKLIHAQIAKIKAQDDIIDAIKKRGEEVSSAIAGLTETLRRLQYDNQRLSKQLDTVSGNFLIRLFSGNSKHKE